MVNREVELALLDHAWDAGAARQRPGRAAFRRAGIGKSRLVRAVTARLEAAAHQVILLPGSPYFSDSPLHPVVEFIEQSTDHPQGRRTRGAARGSSAMSDRSASRCPSWSRFWPICWDRAEPLLGPGGTGAARAARPHAGRAVRVRARACARAAGRHRLRGSALGRSDHARMAQAAGRSPAIGRPCSP